MNNKGQLFATDFLIALTIILLGFGMIAAVSEYSMYQNKEHTNYKELQEASETAAITLANANWATCEFGGTQIAYSISKGDIGSNLGGGSPTKLQAELKKRLGLVDYNTSIKLSSTNLNEFPADDLTDAKNIAVIDINVLVCNPEATYLDLNNCINGNCNPTGKISKETLTIKVGK